MINRILLIVAIFAVNFESNASIFSNISGVFANIFRKPMNSKMRVVGPGKRTLLKNPVKPLKNKRQSSANKIAWSKQRVTKGSKSSHTQARQVADAQSKMIGTFLYEKAKKHKKFVENSQKYVQLRSNAQLNVEEQDREYHVRVLPNIFYSIATMQQEKDAKQNFVDFMSFDLEEEGKGSINSPATQEEQLLSRVGFLDNSPATNWIELCSTSEFFNSHGMHSYFSFVDQVTGNLPVRNYQDYLSVDIYSAKNNEAA